MSMQYRSIHSSIYASRFLCWRIIWNTRSRNFRLLISPTANTHNSQLFFYHRSVFHDHIRNVMTHNRIILGCPFNGSLDAIKLYSSRFFKKSRTFFLSIFHYNFVQSISLEQVYNIAHLCPLCNTPHTVNHQLCDMKTTSEFRTVSAFGMSY